MGPEVRPLPRRPHGSSFAGTRLALFGGLALALGVACSPGSPVLCESGLPDGGCAWHVEVHCGNQPLCTAGSVQVLDAGSCVRDTSADVIGCS